MSKLTVGIPGWKSESGVMGVGSNYLEWIDKFGNPRIILPWEEKVKVDLLLLPGGPDLNPSSYGATPGYKTGETCPYRQHFFDKRLDNYIGNTSIMGICLGFQMLAVKFGATLNQHLISHPMSPDRFEAGHRIQFTPEAVKLVGPEAAPPTKKGIEVNSHHHQGIMVDEFPHEQLTLLAHYENVAEAFVNTKLKIAAVAYHPEEWYDTFSFALVKLITKS